MPHIFKNVESLMKELFQIIEPFLVITRNAEYLGKAVYVETYSSDKRKIVSKEKRYIEKKLQ